MGAFFAESLIFAETANSVGAIQVASTTQLTQTPFFIAACDYVLIGDEFYAASAYLTRQPVLLGSLVGQDWSKVLIIATLVIGTLTTSIQIGNPFTGVAMITQEKKNTKFAATKNANEQPGPRPIDPSDTFFSQLINQQKDPDLAKQIKREPDPVSKKVDEMEAAAAAKAAAAKRGGQ
jgi:hypothetical protein